jgi:hypothetical protein
VFQVLNLRTQRNLWTKLVGLFTPTLFWKSVGEKLVKFNGGTIMPLRLPAPIQVQIGGSFP